mgnify:CR=1 FL=1
MATHAGAADTLPGLSVPTVPVEIQEPRQDQRQDKREDGIAFPPATVVWQTFKPGWSGELVEVVTGPVTGMFWLFEGEGTGGSMLWSDEAAPDGHQRFDGLLGPPVLTAGQTYTLVWGYVQSGGLARSVADEYPVGCCYVDGVRQNYDVAFSTIMMAPRHIPKYQFELGLQPDTAGATLAIKGPVTATPSRATGRASPAWCRGTTP